MEIRPLPVVRSADAALWYDDARALALGCTLCPDLDLCGGLRIKGGAYDCRFLCACQRGGKCSGVCRGDQREFIRRVREVGGFALDDVPCVAPLPVPAITPWVPMIYNGTNRKKALAVTSDKVDH